EPGRGSARQPHRRQGAAPCLSVASTPHAKVETAARRTATRDDNAAPSARPFWSGTLTFGLVSIPVDLYSASRPRAKGMRMVDKEGHPLGRQYRCPRDGQVLSTQDLVRGYETAGGQMVTF